MAKARRKYWHGSSPARCDLCGGPTDGEFVDGKLRSGGMWGILCLPCHSEHGVGLGTGFGQKYKKIGKNWEKVEG